jgi:glutamate-1-semialdehyde 2,1-aminomutase
VARAVTRRDRIVKFEGGYHGHSDGLLVAAGSGATTFGVPSSAGVPDFMARNTWILPYNDAAALEDLFLKQGPNIAAVIVEPVCGNMGVVSPDDDFLKSLCELTRRHGELLIFDEVMTGFRLAWGGAQELYGINADLTCLGKIIGGGFAVGAFGGPKEFMEMVAPLGPVYQAGTLSGNPVAMAAGLATLKVLESTRPYSALARRTAGLAASIRAAAQKRKIPVQVNQAGSMFTVFFTDQPVTSYFAATQSDTRRYATFFHALLKAGVSMPPSQFEAAFVSTAHTEAVLAKAKKAFEKALDAVARMK